MKQSNGRRYFDHAASTPVDPRVVEAMKPYWNTDFGNPNALHAEARTARKAVENARTTIAKALHCKPSELFFTGSGTESNNIAIFGAVDSCSAEGLHLVTSSIEHPSVLDCFKTFERRGAHVEYIGVDAEGILDMKAFEEAVHSKTILVSVMFANNEIGTLQPMSAIAKIMKKKCPQALFHSDASQAPLFYAMDVASLGVHLLTVDGQKIHGPKGVGALYKHSNATLTPLLYGGKQESGLRPGTENVPCIVGMAKAYEIAEAQRAEDCRRVTQLRDYFVTSIQKTIPTSIINGSTHERLPNNVNVSFEGVEGEFLVLQLDEAGIACAARSACFGSGGEGSSVVAAIDPARSGSAVRFSFGRDTTKEDIEYVISALQEKVNV